MNKTTQSNDMTAPLIQLNNICKSYQLGRVSVPALTDINLNINHGEYIAILGPSGSGKSTLMNIIGCLDSPSSGQYLLNDRDVSQLKRNELARIRNQHIGFIFQNFNLLEYSTAQENVALPMVYRGIGSRSRHKKAEQLLARVGLADRANHRPNELSGGQRQRVAIARALVTEPNVILADEPTGNLDSTSGTEIIKLFEESCAQGKTVIIVTHDITIAKRTRRIINISDGRIVADNKN